MIEFLLVSFQWVGMLLLLSFAGLVAICASEEAAHGRRTRYEPMTTHDWDALAGARESRRHRNG